MNLTQTGLGSNPGLGGDRPATNHLRHWIRCRKTCSIATLSTINLTWTDLGSKPDHRGD